MLRMLFLLVFRGKRGVSGKLANSSDLTAPILDADGISSTIQLAQCRKILHQWWAMAGPLRGTVDGLSWSKNQ